MVRRSGTMGGSAGGPRGEATNFGLLPAEHIVAHLATQGREMTSLLLHPVGLDRTTWDAVPLTSSLAIDLPGHGDSLWRPMASLPEVADVVAEQARSYAVPLDVIGVSLGGMIALHLALKHPHLVRSLVVACAPASSPRDVLMARGDMTESAGMEGTLTMTINRWFTEEEIARRGAAVRETERRLRDDDPAVIAQYWRMMAAHDVRDRLSEITVPTTVLAARGDRSTPPGQLRRISEDVARGRHVELDGPHMIHLSDPVGFAGVMTSHLAWVETLESR